jgi:hypothetical protein
VEYNCALIKLDLLAACIALGVVGAIPYLSFPGVGIQFAQSSSQYEARKPGLSTQVHTSNNPIHSVTTKFTFYQFSLRINRFICLSRGSIS